MCERVSPCVSHDFSRPGDRWKQIIGELVPRLWAWRWGDWWMSDWDTNHTKLCAALKGPNENEPDEWKYRWHSFIKIMTDASVWRFNISGLHRHVSVLPLSICIRRSTQDISPVITFEVHSTDFKNEQKQTICLTNTTNCERSL